MNERLRRHLDHVFAPYGDLPPIKELKDELYSDLKEKLHDLKGEGYDDEAAFKETVDSIGEVSELMESTNTKTSELQRVVGMDFSSNLEDADFNHADLSNGSFKCCNLAHADFSGADLTAARLVKSNLKGARFEGTVLEGTVFTSSNLAGAHFDDQTLSGTVFDYAGLSGTSFRRAVLRRVSFKTNVRKAVFEGATMDKLTYAFLKANKADLTGVTVL